MKQSRLAPILLVGLLLAVLLASGCGLLPGSSSAEPTPTPKPPGPVRADFYASQTERQGKGRIQFISTSTGDVKEWLWDLDGDGKIDANGPEASKYYSADGHYTVTLSIEGWDGSTDTMTKTDYIYVWGCRT